MTHMIYPKVMKINCQATIILETVVIINPFNAEIITGQHNHHFNRYRETIEMINKILRSNHSRLLRNVSIPSNGIDDKSNNTRQYECSQIRFCTILLNLT